MLMLKIVRSNMRRIISRFVLQHDNLLYRSENILNKNFNTHQKSFNVADVSNVDVSENFLQEIKTAHSTLHLFEMLANKENKLSNQEVIESFKLLFTLQKSGNSTLQSSEIMKHPQFELLCKRLKSASRSLDINGIIDILKILSYIGVSTNSEIVYILLNLLRRQINDVTLSHITFLDFLLKKFDHSPLIEALQIALPMIFQIQLSIQIDHENVPELIELLAFASKNNISDPCTMSIVTALTLHGNQLKADEAKSIVWSLCDMENFKHGYEKLLNNAIEVLNENFKELTYESLEITISKLLDKYIHKHEIFYNENLFNKCAIMAIELDVGFTKASYVLKKFNKINFVNIRLLDYLAEKVLQNPKLIINARPSGYFTYITGFSTANYQPKQWDIIKSYIFENPILISDKNELPWMKFNIELMSLGCYNEKLLEKVFDDDFLEKYLAREQNFLDYLQFLSLYQSVMILHSEYSGKMPNSKFIDKAMELNVIKDTFPLKGYLEYIFGGESFVWTKLKTKFGHFINHAIFFNENLQPIEVCRNAKTSDIVQIENLISDNHKIVSVLSLPRTYFVLNFPRLKGIFDLQIRTLEALGIPVAVINYHQWTQMPDHEKLFYLEREIKYKIKSIEK